MTYHEMYCCKCEEFKKCRAIELTETAKLWLCEDCEEVLVEKWIKA